MHAKDTDAGRGRGRKPLEGGAYSTEPVSLGGCLIGSVDDGAARAWLDERLNDVVGVGFYWQSLLAFVRFASNPRIFPRPLSD